MADQAELLRRQQALAAFGDFVLDHDDLHAVLTEGCRIVAAALNTDLAKVLEIETKADTALVKAGVGWDPAVIGHMRIQLDEHSSEAFAIATGKPVITQNIAMEGRFDFPPFMMDHGVKALVNVPILLPGRVPYGVLQVDARQPRDFNQADIGFLKTYAMVLGPVIDRLNKVRDLAQATERYRLIVENARDYAILLTDAEDRITGWLQGAQAIFGWTEEEAIGQPGAIIFTAEDRENGVPGQEVATARRDGKAPNVRWHVRKDGKQVFIDGQTTMLRNADGSSAGFMKIGQDITERKRSEEALQLNEARLRLAMETARVGTWDWDMVADSVDWSEEHYRLLGYQVGQVEPRYDSWVSCVHPEDREATERALLVARDNHSPYACEFRTLHADGEILWCSALGQFFYNDDGLAVRMIGAIQDVTDRRQWHERQQVLIGELQHRTRNLIGIVRSISDKTIKRSTSLADFDRRFSDRIDALARVQGLLSRLTDERRLAFDELMDSEIAALSGDSEGIHLKGPRGILLRSSMVQTLAMAIHELATNAAKYGALVHSGACLVVAWQYEPHADDGLPWLHIDWRESKVPMDENAGAPKGTGQGRELIERALPYQLSAKTSFTMGADGVHCTISIPVSSRNEVRNQAND